jgi:hypothetical protein
VFVAVTEAPGTTEPLGSVTMPEMLPVMLAHPTEAASRIPAKTIRKR